MSMEDVAIAGRSHLIPSSSRVLIRTKFPHPSHVHFGQKFRDEAHRKTTS
jgi:hypothetical protein